VQSSCRVSRTNTNDTGVRPCACSLDARVRCSGLRFPLPTFAGPGRRGTWLIRTDEPRPVW
jgi:hypothetical protein